ncbi:MAG TPA: acyltransferase [Acidimicrobiales bacterium]|nr:acyltransferase [Acidimicrobiales bacterium]
MTEVTAARDAHEAVPAGEPPSPVLPQVTEIEPGQEAPTPPHPPRFPAFDGLRAIAAGTVVGVHVGFISGLTLRNASVGVYTARLEIGVSVFFLISGFLLYRPFTVAHLTAERHPGTGAFWMRRLLRIVPAYWVALFVTTTILHANPVGMGPGGWQAYAYHYLFAQIYVPSQALGGISQAWTLCVEMTFYLLLPLYALYVGRRAAHRTPGQRFRRELCFLVVLVMISLAWRFWVLSNQHGHGAIFSAMTVWLPAELDLFALGMLLAVLSGWMHLRDAEPGWMSARWFPWASWLLAAVCFWGVSHLGLPRDVIYTKSDVDITRQTLYGLFAWFLLLPAVFGPQDRGLVRRFLRSWPMASLGVISYGVYLWHQTMLNELVKYYQRWFGIKLFFNVGFWGMFGEVFGAAIVVATVSYFVIEKPALRAKRFFAWFSSPPARSRPDVPVDAGPQPASTG